MFSCTVYNTGKGSVDGLAGPANAVPLSTTIRRRCTTICSRSHAFHDCTKAWLREAGFFVGIYCIRAMLYAQIAQIVLQFAAVSMQFTKYRSATATYIHAVWILLGMADVQSAIPLYIYLQSCAAPVRYLSDNGISVVEGLEECRQLTELHVAHQRLSEGEKLLFDPRTLQAIAVSVAVCTYVVYVNCMFSLMMYIYICVCIYICACSLS